MGDCSPRFTAQGDDSDWDATFCSSSQVVSDTLHQFFPQYALGSLIYSLVNNSTALKPQGNCIWPQRFHWRVVAFIDCLVGSLWIEPWLKEKMKRRIAELKVAKEWYITTHKMGVSLGIKKVIWHVNAIVKIEGDPLPQSAYSDLQTLWKDEAFMESPNALSH